MFPYFDCNSQKEYKIYPMDDIRKLLTNLNENLPVEDLDKCEVDFQKSVNILSEYHYGRMEELLAKNITNWITNYGYYKSKHLQILRYPDMYSAVHKKRVIDGYNSICKATTISIDYPVNIQGMSDVSVVMAAEDICQDFEEKFGYTINWLNMMGENSPKIVFIISLNI